MPLGCGSFSGIPCFLMAFNWRSTGQIFCRISLSWDLSYIFVMTRHELWFLKRKTTKVKCHSKPIISRVHFNNIKSLCITWRRSCLSDFSSVKWLLFYMVLFGRKFVMAAHTGGMRSDVPPLWTWSIYTKYMKFLCTKDLSILFYLFIQSFIYIGIHSCIFGGCFVLVCVYCFF